VYKRNQFSSLYLDLYIIGFNNSFVSLPFLCTIAFGCSKKVNFSIIDKSKVMQIQNIVFWTCCSFAYLKHVWLFLNTRIVLGHKILLLPFILHLFLEKRVKVDPIKAKYKMPSLNEVFPIFAYLPCHCTNPITLIMLSTANKQPRNPRCYHIYIAAALTL